MKRDKSTRLCVRFKLFIGGVINCLVVLGLLAAFAAGCQPPLSRPTIAATMAPTQLPTSTATSLPSLTPTPKGAIQIPMDTKTSPENRFLYLSVWSFQIGNPEDCREYAKLAKELGFDGIGFIVTWDRIELNKDQFDFYWLDKCLDIFTSYGLKLALGLMFWTGYISWRADLCLQQTADGSTYIFDNQRGSMVCLNDEATLLQVHDALSAWAEHTMQRYGPSIVKYSAHFSVYGEVEYSPVDAAIDYSPSEQRAFRAYMRARAGGLDAINRDYELRLANWDEFEALPIKQLLTHSDYDWQLFRQQTLIKINQLVSGTIHAVAPDKLVAMQVGSVWDTAAATLRGVFDPYLISRDVDVLHIDDAPGWPHDFSCDLTESMIPDRLLAQELDGAQHTQAIPDLYLRQARMTGEAGVTIMNTANWSPATIKQWSAALFSKYRALFKEAAVRQLAPRDRAILYNTADFISRQQRSPQDVVLGGTYSKLSQGGKLRVRFISDSMILANPLILDELSAGLYLGRESTMRFDPRVAEILAKASCPLYFEGIKPKLTDPFGHPLAPEVEQQLLTRMQ